ncbi:hypothetical protein [Enterobacter hormaechei]|uniref:hypothetical protein n=1 Tax=Enterobacter hormaechei TaxID=158836 RepID=UPI001A951BF2|nr:hypothetical protein [Enterobacter hormaechei]
MPTRQPDYERKMQGRHRRPQRRYSDDDLDGSPANIERENDGKNGIRRKNLRPGEDGGGANPCI